MQVSEYIRTSFIDYPGNISSVIFTKGCNMNCPYCHNKDIDDSEKEIEIDSILDHLNKRKNVLECVTITGGEPTLNNDLIDLCKKIKSIGYKIKLDTNGTNSGLLINLIENKLVDYIAMDIKSSPGNYKKVCGLSFDKVKESFEIIKSFDNYEFRTTMYPDIKKQDLLEIIPLINKGKYFIQQYRKTNHCNIEPYSDIFVKNLCNELNIKYRGINL